MSAILWLKAFHIVFVVAWFAGLLYLPRLFVYHADTNDSLSRERFKVMERRLFGMMTLGGILAGAFGISIIIIAPAYLQMAWLHAKLGLVVLLLIYHFWCYRLMLAFRQDRNSHHAHWYRWFNELPTLLLIAIVVLVVIKPF